MKHALGVGMRRGEVATCNDVRTTDLVADFVGRCRAIFGDRVRELPDHSMAWDVGSEFAWVQLMGPATVAAEPSVRIQFLEPAALKATTRTIPVARLDEFLRELSQVRP